MARRMSAEDTKEPAAVLVTGASRGLGRGTALELARAGFSVAVHYAKNREAAEETATACRDAAPHAAQRFPIVVGDVSLATDREALFAAALAASRPVGRPREQRGHRPPRASRPARGHRGELRRLVAREPEGPVLPLPARGPTLPRPCRGRAGCPGGYKLVFVSSMSAHTVSVNRGDYCVSKAGLAMAAQLFAARLAARRRAVFELRPGIMATDMTAGVKEKYERLIAEGLVPQGRWGTRGDVGLAVAALMAGGFPFSTGAVIPIDGGRPPAEALDHAAKRRPR